MVTILVTLVTFLVIGSVVFLIASIYNLYTHYEGTNENPLALIKEKKSDYKGIRNTVEIIEFHGFIKRTRYMRMLLSVAFIHYEHKKILLCKFDRGEFSGYWGFPSGYVDPHNREEYLHPLKKAFSSINEYVPLELHSKIEYKDIMTTEPLNIDYSNPTNPEVIIYEFILAEEPDGGLGETCRLVDLKEMEALKVYPLAYELLKHYWHAEFSNAFEREIKDIMDRRRAIIENMKNLVNIEDYITDNTPEGIEGGYKNE